MRFASTLRVVVAERRWRATKLIWRDSTPQHYATLSGFYNTNAKIINWPMSGNGKCVPIKDSFRLLANGRNNVAEHIRLEYMNTFSFDVARPHLPADSARAGSKASRAPRVHEHV